MAVLNKHFTIQLGTWKWSLTRSKIVMECPNNKLLLGEVPIYYRMAIVGFTAKF